MKISVDTKEDSHDEIKKVIRMLQNLVGDSQEVFTNQPSSEISGSTTEDAFTNIFEGSSDATQESSNTEQASQESQASQELKASQELHAAQESQASQESQTEEPQAGETIQSTEDLFAELFNEEELKKMEAAPAKEEEEKEEELPKAKSKKYSIEFY